MKKEVNWSRVAELCRQSFTGRGLSESESEYMQKAYLSDPQEYVRVTHDVRDQERSQMRSF